MYLLLSRIPSGLDPLRLRFEQHVKKAGLESVEKIVGEAQDAVEPKAYVDALLAAHKRNAELVTKAFRGDQGFVASLDRVSRKDSRIRKSSQVLTGRLAHLSQACREFVNRNKACGISSNRSPELLARYADGLLRKSNKTGEDADLEQSLADTVSVWVKLPKASDRD
jgi:cullin 1